MKENNIYPTLFEDNYILRALGSIVLQPDIALTELVANAWDAGASHVAITIPDQKGQILSIEDDGVGMTEEEFQNRWMKLRYNRLVNQGKKVVFPQGIVGTRSAFGRNGVGRHGLFCFGDEYSVFTSKDGLCSHFIVKPNVQTQPFAAIKKSSNHSLKHGTHLEVTVSKNLPNPDKIIELISARFLLDPSFIIKVNGRQLDLVDLSGGQSPKSIDIPDIKVHLELYFIDTTKSGKKSIFQGIAFWQSGRLVGEPSWTLGNINILDGRTSLAKRYTVVVKTNDLAEDVKDDWSGFNKSDKIDIVYREVEKALNQCFEEAASITLSSVKENFSQSVKDAIAKFNPLVKKEFDETIASIVYQNPKARQESIDIAAQAIINLEKTKNGQELLEKLAGLSEQDVDGLNAILSKWSISDATAVLNEIDRRLSVISAIRKLAGDKNTDELHVLHPLITEARWLFGPEYESSEYIFNRQLGTVVEKLFGKDKIDQPQINYKNRPDLICLPNSSYSITGIEDSSNDISLIQLRKVLIIELKRGDFKISRDERNQIQGYVEDLHNSNLGKDCDFTAFVVGYSLDRNISTQTNVCDGHGRIYITTYDQLIDTAEKRMFGLRGRLARRYDDIPGMELFKQLSI